MSTRAVRWALNEAPMLTTRRGGSDVPAHLILVALAETARGEPPVAFPTFASLELMTGLNDKRTIARALDRLSSSGLITDAGVRQSCTVWRLNLAQKRDFEALAREQERQRQRQRALTRERVRRWRERRRLGTGVTLSDAVTDDLVTAPESVTGGDVTASGADVTASESVTHSALSSLNRKDEPKEPLSSPRPPDDANALVPLAALAEIPGRPRSTSGGRPRSTSPGATGAVGFAEFWAVYPKRVAKKDAERKFAKAVKDGADPAEIIAGAERYAESRNGDNPKFTKHPGTWLNQGCWADEYPEPRGLTLAQGHRPFKNPDDQSVYYEEF